MLVELTKTWFAPAPAVAVNKVMTTSGRRYKAGIHEMPDEWHSILPRDAKVIDEMPAAPAEAPAPVQTLRDFDEQRANSDAEMRVLEAAEAKEAADLDEKKQAMRDRMAKARAARGRKKE